MSVGIAPYAGIVLNSFTFMSAVIPDAVINLPMICFINFCVAIGIFIALAILFKILIATKRIVPEFEMGNSDIV